jgi:hypothetical protein
MFGLRRCASMEVGHLALTHIKAGFSSQFRLRLVPPHVCGKNKPAIDNMIVLILTKINQEKPGSILSRNFFS